MPGQGAAGATHGPPFFGEVLRRLRLAAGMSQEELAEKTGLSVHGISDLERGARLRPYLHTVECLADGLGLQGSERAELFAARRPTRLAAPPTPSTAPQHLLRSFIGRDRELIEVPRLLRRTRVLTLTGPGGCGKTRLALEVARVVARTFADGVTFVDLASVDDAALVASAIAQALEVRETAGQSLVASLQAALKDQQRLLVLDNFEQLLPAAQLVAELMHSSTRLRALVTSRTRLRLAAEQEYPVPPLQVPTLLPLPGLPQMARVPAVALFVQRAQAAQPSFHLTDANARAVAELCVRLDGLPLALELAAARIRFLSASAILGRLQRCLNLVIDTSSALHARQQTLCAAIGWSYDLLEPHAQALLRRLSVFAGGWSLQAAEAMCNEAGDAQPDALQTLAALVDWNLVQPTQDVASEPRFGMLETIREYGRDQLTATGELDRVQRQHAAFYLALAEQSEPALNGPQQSALLGRLEREHDNLRAALRYCAEPEKVEEGMRLGAALWPFWYARGHLTEGRAQLKELLQRPESRRPSKARRLVRARAMNGAGYLAWAQADYVAARSLHQQSLAIARTLGDQLRIALSLNNLGIVASDTGDCGAARSLYEESLTIRRALGDRPGIGASLNNLGEVAQRQGDFKTAARMYEDSLTIWLELGDRGGIAHSLNNLGTVASDQGDFATARRLYEESLTIRRELGDRQRIAASLINLGEVAQGLDDLAAAAALFGESLVIFRELGDRWGIAYALESFAKVAAGGGQATRAVRLASAASTLRETVGAPLPGPQHEQYQRTLEQAVQALSEPDRLMARGEGKAMSLEQAMDYALAGTVG